MKKVINVTLGGIVFAIEEDAYAKLAGYLASIETVYKTHIDYEEIAGDIESAIAEKFLARKKNGTHSVTIEDVDGVVTEMGSVEEFAGEPEAHAAAADLEPEAETARESETVKKRLYRDGDDVVIAGVASGIARYFAIDPVIVRVLFVIAIFMNGFGILAYIILWFVMPLAKTTTEKYAMRGEQLTLSKITSRVEDAVEEARRAHLGPVKSLWSRARPVLVRLFEFVGTIVRALVRVLRYVVGVVFILGGTFGIAGLLSGYSVLLSGGQDWMHEVPREIIVALTESAIGIVTLGAGFTIVFIPLVILIMAGIGIVTRRNPFTLMKVIVMGIVWVCALALLVSTIFMQVDRFKQIDAEYVASHEEGYNLLAPE